MTKITYNIPNISCMHCVHTIKSELSEVKGVKSVEAWADKKQAEVAFEDPASDEQIRQILTDIGYPPEAA